MHAYKCCILVVVSFHTPCTTFSFESLSFPQGYLFSAHSFRMGPPHIVPASVFQTPPLFVYLISGPHGTTPPQERYICIRIHTQISWSSTRALSFTSSSLMEAREETGKIAARGGGVGERTVLNIFVCIHKYAYIHMYTHTYTD